MLHVDPLRQPRKEQFNYGNALVKPTKHVVALSSDMAKY